jgi:hypothetical protein
MGERRRWKSLLEWVAGADSIILVVCGVLLVVDGNLRIGRAAAGTASAFRVLMGSAELTLAIILLWATVSRWAKWIPALTALAILKALFSLRTGRMFSFPDRPLPRTETATFILIAGAILALTWRFIDHKPKPQERVGLLVVLVSTFPLVSFSAHSDIQIVSLLLGMAVLGLIRWRLTHRRHERPGASIGAQTSSPDRQ